jgi:Bacterial EndoU nuclease
MAKQAYNRDKVPGKLKLTALLKRRKIKPASEQILAAFALSLAMVLTVFVGSVGSEVACAGISHWSATSPPINQQHVFCGEWNSRKNRPAGFHSRPAGENPTTVGTVTVTQQANAKGLYGVRWSYAGHPDRKKFSTMFPDTCGRDQVLKSIVYAVKHPGACPEGAPPWAKCGPNKPPGNGRDYCEASDGSIFAIAFATLKGSDKVNTAFPIAE